MTRIKPTAEEFTVRLGTYHDDGWCVFAPSTQGGARLSVHDTLYEARQRRNELQEAADNLEARS